MPPDPVPDVQKPTRLIPDCCNTGVVFRVLLCANGVVLLSTMVQGSSSASGISRFLDAAPMVELVSLFSLVGLCVLRPAAARLWPWLQRSLCIALPAAIAGFLAWAFARIDFLAGAGAVPGMPEAMILAGVFGGVLQHYFELRQRAFSPVLVEARLQALQARIRPHFLFNSLNAVLSLIRTEPRKAEDTLEDLADLFRVFMRDTRDMTTLDQEIRLCNKYLAIEKIRLGSRLQVAWHLDGISEQVIERAQIPALLLQPLIENAVHYGVEPSVEPATIVIRLTRSIDRIEIAITNPYHGEVVPSGGNHMALNNIRQRLALLYDVEGSLSTRAADGAFVVHLRIPYVKIGQMERAA